MRSIANIQWRIETSNGEKFESGDYKSTQSSII
jgi:hypothetical protein